MSVKPNCSLLAGIDNLLMLAEESSLMMKRYFPVLVPSVLPIAWNNGPVSLYFILNKNPKSAFPGTGSSQGRKGLNFPVSLGRAC